MIRHTPPPPPDDDCEVARELAFHLEMRTRQHQAAGLDLDTARRRAQAELGDLARTTATCRDFAGQRDARERRRAARRSLVDDTRSAMTHVARRPGTAAVVSATLVAGIALTSAALTLSAAVFAAPMPFRDADRLVVVQARRTSDGTTRDWVSGYSDYRDLHDLTGGVLRLTTHSAARPLNLRLGAQAEIVQAEFVSAGYFDVLGTSPARGRPFRADEDDPLAPAGVVILSHHFWRDRLEAADGVIGRRLSINGSPYEVVGVMPAGFRGLTDRADLWLPVTTGRAIYTSGYVDNRALRWLSLAGRLEPGVTIDRAAAALETASARLAELHPGQNADLTFEPRLLAGETLGAIRRSFVAALGAAGLVLLLVYVNIAALSLSRAVAGAGELALRRALGASRARLGQQVLLQSLVTCVPAAVAALMLSGLLVSVIAGSGAFQIPSYVDVSARPWIVGVIALLALGGTTALSLAPLALAGRREAVALPSRSTAPPLARRLRRTFIAAQIGVACALLFMGALMLRTVGNLRGDALGWNPDQLTSARIDLPAEAYDSDESKWQLASALLAAVGGREPAAIAVSGPGGLPMLGLFLRRFSPDETHRGLPDDPLWVSYHLVTPGYFDVMGIPVRRGRGFTAQDRAGAEPIAIVTESLARRLWPGVDAVGRRLKSGARDSDNAWMTVVGVTSDVRFEGHVREPSLAAPEHLFLPLSQDPPSLPPRLMVSVRGEPSAALAAVRNALREAASEMTLTLGAGLALGLAAGVMLSHLARALLHGVEPADPAAGALVAALLAFSALAGAWAPLRRAATLEPATALRQGD